jgi:hypothetical protein
MNLIFIMQLKSWNNYELINFERILTIKVMQKWIFLKYVLTVPENETNLCLKLWMQLKKNHFFTNIIDTMLIFTISRNLKLSWFYYLNFKNNSLDYSIFCTYVLEYLRKLSFDSILFIVLEAYSFIFKNMISCFSNLSWNFFDHEINSIKVN